MTTYKLSYFPIKARGEFSRLVFAAAGKEYEDVRIAFDDWPKHKPNIIFGQLPVLEITCDGKTFQLAQGYTIARFLAQEFGLAGKDKFENALTDQFAGVVEDLFAPCARIFFEKDEARKAENLKKYLDETSVGYFTSIDQTLGKSQSGFIVGDSLTYADLALLNLHDFMESTLKEDAGKILAKYPKVLQHREKIKALPRIAAWLEKRPKSDL